ncbi:MAG: leucine-rich repeat domain-containing protein [Eubacteriaceae bacterium]|nr:leucine-rich repeat domain-containing protein [Eubacteriaceae bacterium]
MRKLTALILCAMLIIFIYPLGAMAEGEDTDPDQILSDPGFDLNTVDEGILSAWYASDIYVPDEALRRALQSAARAENLTVEAMFSLPTSLDLSSLGISDLTGLEYAINVTELNISGNTVSSLYPIRNLYNLKKLDYSSNQVPAVPAWIFTARSLSYVNGSSNGSTSVEGFSLCSNVLDSQYLENNMLSDLPDMSALTSLDTLSLAGNKFSTFPSAVLGFTGLKILSMSNNALTEVPDLSSFGSLNTIYLDTNRLSTVPEGLEKIPTLTDVYLFSNEITEIRDGLMDSSSIISLYLYFNSIQVLPSKLVTMPSLKNLDVSFNMISVDKNSTVIADLSDSLSAFHHSFQLPVLSVGIYPPDGEGTRCNVIWNQIDQFSNEEGSYSVVKYVIERRIDETASPEALVVTSSSGTEEEGTQQEGTAQEGEPQEGAPQEGAPQQESSQQEEGQTPEVTVLPNEFEVIGEVDGTVSNFYDTDADEDIHYIYRVTAYVSCEYRKAAPVLYTVQSEASTTEMVNDLSGRDLFIYIGCIVAFAAAMTAAIIHVSRTKKKPVRKDDIRQQKREEAIERSKRLPRKADLSESVSKAWVEQDGLEDELEKILSTSDDEVLASQDEPKEKNPIGDVFSEAKKERRRKKGRK